MLEYIGRCWNLLIYPRVKIEKDAEKPWFSLVDCPHQCLFPQANFIKSVAIENHHLPGNPFSISINGNLQYRSTVKICDFSPKNRQVL
jgi:hypothetical protein